MKFEDSCVVPVSWLSSETLAFSASNSSFRLGNADNSSFILACSSSVIPLSAAAIIALSSSSFCVWEVADSLLLHTYKSYHYIKWCWNNALKLHKEKLIQMRMNRNTTSLLFQPVSGPPVWKSACFLQQVVQELPGVEQIGRLIRKTCKRCIFHSKSQQ